jgi:hypothetical protein
MADPPKPAPPARVAATAGDRGYVPDFDPGKSSLTGEKVQVVPVMQRQGDVASPAMVEGITIRPAKVMTAAEARNTMARIITDMLVWIDGWPHDLHGEEAYVLEIFREIATRRKLRTQAGLHDQDIVADDIDKAHYEPKP